MTGPKTGGRSVAYPDCGIWQSQTTLMLPPAFRRMSKDECRMCQIYLLMEGHV